MNFPRLVYKSASEHRAAETQEELDELCNEGWFPSVPEALEGKLEVVQKESEAVPTRAELETKAKELGIQFSKKTTDAELSASITKALAKE